MTQTNRIYQKPVTLQVAHAIQKTLGTRRAAGYLRNRDVPLEIALFWLVLKPVLQGRTA
jgi:hypothetical protein